MHIPDGFLDLPLCILMYTLSIALLLPALRSVGRTLGERQIPLMSMVTAGVFAAQMLNFPIIGGTSGHLVGGALIAILLGPHATVISMSVTLLIQALLFGDGGITTLGANIFNMGVIGASGYYIFKILSRSVGGRRGFTVGVAAASWLTIVLGAVACGIELGLSSTFQPLGGWRVTVPAMTLWHVIIGVGEALITLSILTYIRRVRPDLLGAPRGGPELVEVA